MPEGPITWGTAIRVLVDLRFVDPGEAGVEQLATLAGIPRSDVVVEDRIPARACLHLMWAMDYAATCATLDLDADGNDRMTPVNQFRVVLLEAAGFELMRDKSIAALVDRAGLRLCDATWPAGWLAERLIDKPGSD